MKGKVVYDGFVADPEGEMAARFGFSDMPFDAATEALIEEARPLVKGGRYLETHSPERRRLQSIGEKLNKAGGLRLMQAVCYRIGKTDRAAIGAINYGWDGIGDWCC